MGGKFDFDLIKVFMNMTQEFQMWKRAILNNHHREIS